MGSMKKTGLLLGFWMGVLFCCASPASNGPAHPIYKYEGPVLHLAVASPHRQLASITWIPISDRGRPQGHYRKKEVFLEAGQNTIALQVGDATAHRLRFELGGVNRDIWANRGTWFSLPKTTSVGETRTPTYTNPLIRPSDVGLARGFAARVKRSPLERSFMTLGRTLGYASSFGVAVDKKKYALVLIASGSVGPIKITLGQRISKQAIAYWDYSLVLDPHSRRYVIPFDSFTGRGQTIHPFKTLHSITLRSLHPIARNDTMSIGFIGLTSPGPVVSKIRRTKDNIWAEVTGAVDRQAMIHFSDETGRTEGVLVQGRAVALPRGATKVWLCYEEAGESKAGAATNEALVVRICDPADAPHSTFQVPPPEGARFVIDTFDTLAHVNAYRMPVSVFGSSEAVERRMVFRRRPGALYLKYFPQATGDYGGYFTRMPLHIPTGMKSLAFELKGSMPPEAVRIGLKDSNYREGRVSLRSYLYNSETAASCDDFTSFAGNHPSALGEQFRAVSIPIEAFRAVVAAGFEGQPQFGEMRSVSVTMTNSGKDVSHEIELGDVSLSPVISSLAIARFDGEQPGMNALGGTVFAESNRGAMLTANWNAPGHCGNGLEVRISAARPEAYGLVALCMGRVDSSDYVNLSFWVRGNRGGEDAAIYLNDGKRRYYVSLSEFATVTKEWQQVWIPLSRFHKRGVDLTHLTQVIIAWEGRKMDEEILYFDDFVLE
ncbi:MAG: hypothetical protein QNJ97_01830 [Myxococcota bacterium]|nr:hypothetical protein [Myxococcota bacterium]